MEAFSFDITLPTSWASLTDTQLRYLFKLLAEKRTAIDIQTRCTFHWGGLRVIAHADPSIFIVRKKRGKFRHVDVPLTARQLQPVVDTLRWIEVPPPEPVRIERIGKHRALAADFQKVPFRIFIFTNNLFQGFLHTHSFDLLRQMAEILYDAQGIKPTRAELLSIFYWFTSLKAMFAHRFCHFLQPVSTPDNLLGTPLAQQLQESMDAEIRALTGGDITKEDEILSMDTWRALTELDAKARDYEEMKKGYQK